MLIIQKKTHEERKKTRGRPVLLYKMTAHAPMLDKLRLLLQRGVTILNDKRQQIA